MTSTRLEAAHWLPLTNAQQLIWANQQLYPDTPLYNMAFMFNISGEISETDFREAFRRLVNQCDSLRTVVENIDGVPHQRVLDTFDYEFPVINLAGGDDPAGAARAWAQNRCESPFLIDRQMFDSALLRVGNTRWTWYFNQHHLVTDAWSSTLIFERLEALYRGVRHGDAPEIPMPPYADYLPVEAAAARETGLTDGRKPARGPVMSLYGRRPPDIGTSNARLTNELTEWQTQQLRDLTAVAGFRALTPDLSRFRIMATALFAYLYRVSGQNRITIGAPAHNRPTAEFRQTAGMFMEVYPLEVEVEDDETFATLHTKVAESADAFIRNARPGGSSAGVNRSISAVLNVIRGDFANFDGLGVHAEWLHPGHVDAEHHVRLHVHDFNSTGHPTLIFDCNRDVLSDDIRSSVPDHFMRLLDAMLSDVDQLIGAVDLLSPAERNSVVGAVHDRGGVVPAPTSVVTQFEHWVETDPEATALRGDGHSWSYREVEAITSRIAGAVSPGTVVGVCLNRSPEAVMAMLGILRGGAAYVPIDPSWPAARIEYVLGDAGCSLVVCDSPSVLSTPSIGFEDLSVAPPADRSFSTGPGDLAYILYTSGSTGLPKGVMIEHGSLANYVAWAHDFYDAGERLSFPLFTPLTFDLTVTSLFVPLTSGGKIVVYPASDGPADTAVQQVFADDAVDIVKLTPSHLALLPDLDFSSSGIRQLILGGEDLTTGVARRAHDRLGGRTRIHNEYGPTEATVGCVVHTYDPTLDRGGSVPIGKPISNMRAYVLDARGHPVPFGVPGELAVAGAGVARGYVGLSDLTRDRFLANPHVGEDRLYRTGDIARVRLDGTIEYLGRRDDQIKIRGARVELGEVEAALASHPQITAAAARVWVRDLPPPTDELLRCTRCGLSSDFPGVSFDAERICNQCRSFATYRDKARVYFKPMAELDEVFTSRPANRSEYDCLALLSGGKDSTYALCRLVDMGLRVLAFTLDNGYISDEAKANIQRVVDALGVDHVFASTPAMNEIFVDSLQRHGNVCNGCFKTIYTLSVQTARERGIPFIVTGLSRGQFFETRLTEELFTELTVNADQIDANVLETRKAYHQVDDAVHRLLDVSIFEDDSVFDEVTFVDFYRYCDVGLDELMAYLDERVPWVRPSDTGRSTNCRINDVGIYYHRRTRGFHNYSLPYSWDVRMGHKSRDAAIEELNDDIDVAAVQQILNEIGFPEAVEDLESGRRLVAYYAAPEEISAGELRAHIGATLPDHMLPALFTRLDAIPLSPNGKVNREALPEPGTARPEVETVFLAPCTDAEVQLARIWEEVLGIEGIGVRDSFFDLGGDSIMAIQIVARAHRAGLSITLHELFEALTVERLARLAADAPAIAAARIVGPVGLTPVQRWFFERYGGEGHFHQVLHVDAPPDVDPGVLSECLTGLADHHDALRQTFSESDGAWTSQVSDVVTSPSLSVYGAAEMDEPARRRAAASLEEPFDLSRAPLLRAGLFRHANGSAHLTIVAHHLIVDAVSWTTIVDDLNHLYRQGRNGEQLALPAVPASISDWVAALTERAPVLDAARWVDAAHVEAPSARELGAAPHTTHTVGILLDRVQTAALERAASDTPVRIEDMLVAALAMTLADANGSATQRLFLEGHGRDPGDIPVDPARTVGWFASLFPVVIEVPIDPDPGSVARTVERELRSVASVGRQYGIVRYLHPDQAVRNLVAVPESTHVVLNYLGRAEPPRTEDSEFSSSGPIQLSRPASLAPAFAAEVSAVIQSSRLSLTWVSAVENPAVIEASVATLAGHLAAVGDALNSGDPEATTGKKFPLANLDEAGIAKLASVLRAGDGQ